MMIKEAGAHNVRADSGIHFVAFRRVGHGECAYLKSWPLA